MSRLTAIFGRFCALAFLLALGVFVLPDRAEAAPLDHRAEAAPLDHRAEAAPLDHRAEAAPLDHRAEAAPLDHRAEAAPLDHRAEAAPMDHGAQHAQHEAAHADDCGDCPSDHGKAMTHMGHGCHCVSAACTPVLPPSGLSTILHQPADSFDPAVAFDAKALASVDPPSEPPRT